MVVEQSARLALALADRAVVLVKGEVRWEGPAATLQERPDLLADLLLERVTTPAAPVRVRAPS